MLTPAEIALVKKNARNVRFTRPNGVAFLAWGVSDGKHRRL